MKFLTRFYRQIRINTLAVAFLVCVIAALFLPQIELFHAGGDNRFTVYLYGEEIGVVTDRSDMDELLTEARRELAGEKDGLYMIEVPELTYRSEESFWNFGATSEAKLKENMKECMKAHHFGTLARTYTVKINTQTVNLKDAEEVKELLATTVARYDTEAKYEVSMGLDPNRELNVLVPQLIRKEAQEKFEFDATIGVEQVFEKVNDNINIPEYMEFEDFETGVTSIEFSEKVEVVEAYVPEADLTSLEEAVNLLTMEQEVQQIYKVQRGDTLSEISLTVGIPMDTIVEMNPDKLDDVNSTLQIDDELIITVPEPELSVIWVNREHYEETYEEEVIYIPNDDWYTNQMVTLQEPSAGFREVIADITYENKDEVGRVVVKQEVIMEAVPKIVERGTKIPPSYIKPLSGGRLSSRFGKRKAPTAGASTYHKGIDWATPIGTPIYASSGGVVAKAGWGKGYGYVVYINHPDGKQTRYAHLSKVLVSPGQSVSQGDRIALSGNTGVSSGPHVHFEILVNGVQKDPMSYLD